MARFAIAITVVLPWRVLGDAKAVVDGCFAAGGVETGRAANGFRRDAGDGRNRFGAVLATGTTKAAQRSKAACLATLGDERLVDQPFGDDHVGQRVHDGDVGSRLEGQMIGGVDVRALHHLGAAGIDDDQLGALRGRGA